MNFGLIICSHVIWCWNNISSIRYLCSIDWMLDFSLNSCTILIQSNFFDIYFQKSNTLNRFCVKADQKWMYLYFESYTIYFGINGKVYMEFGNSWKNIHDMKKTHIHMPMMHLMIGYKLISSKLHVHLKHKYPHHSSIQQNAYTE